LRKIAGGRNEEAMGELVKTFLWMGLPSEIAAGKWRCSRSRASLDFQFQILGNASTVGEET